MAKCFILTSYYTFILFQFEMEFFQNELNWRGKKNVAFELTSDAFRKDKGHDNYKSFQ
jgi:hypothetical protein